jgi:Ulp1 family protease
MIYKELLIKDGLEKEISEKNKLLILKDDQIFIHKQKDTLKEQKIKNLELVILKKDEQFLLEEQKSKDLFKELKSERRKTFMYKAGTFIGLVLTSILLVK